MKEINIKNLIRLEAASAYGLTLLNNPVGVAWQGKVISHMGDSLVLEHPRSITFGLAEGSSDLIGWQTVRISNEDVGRRVAVFTAVEVKRPGEQPTEKQERFLARVRQCGGYAVVLRSIEDLRKMF